MSADHRSVIVRILVAYVQPSKRPAYTQSAEKGVSRASKFSFVPGETGINLPACRAVLPSPGVPLDAPNPHAQL